VVGGDAAEVFFGGVGADAVEEDPYLGLPALQVGAQDVGSLFVGELDSSEGLVSSGGQRNSLVERL
jgi:hypothetical protein